ncbi:hypothetical protein D3C80_1155260 [compost metagenome]
MLTMLIIYQQAFTAPQLPAKAISQPIQRQPDYLTAVARPAMFRQAGYQMGMMMQRGDTRDRPLVGQRQALLVAEIAGMGIDGDRLWHHTVDFPKQRQQSLLLLPGGFIFQRA